MFCRGIDGVHSIGWQSDSGIHMQLIKLTQSTEVGMGMAVADDGVRRLGRRVLSWGRDRLVL